MLRVLLVGLFSVSLLVSCNGEIETKDNENKQNILDKVKEDKEEENINELLDITEDEAEEVANETISNIHRILGEIQVEKSDWAMDFEFLDNIQDYEDRYEYVREQLAPYVKEKAFAMEAGEWIYSYFCHCGAAIALNNYEVMTRLTVEESRPNYFKISYLTIADDFQGGYGTRVLEFVNENDVWQLANSSIISYEDVSYDLTVVDIEDYYKRINLLEGNEGQASVEVEFIEEVHHDGEDFIIVQINEEHYEARNTKDSMLNYELVSEFNNY